MTGLSVVALSAGRTRGAMTMNLINGAGKNAHIMEILTLIPKYGNHAI